MRDDAPENDPKTIWLNQPTEPSLMTLEKIRQKARELHAKTRRQLVGSVAAPLIAIAFYAFGAKHSPALQPVLAFAVAWGLAGLYFVNRGMRSAPMPADAALSTGIETYRREIERRRDFLRRALLWSFGPL